jgi:hypothetical protein
MFRSFVLGKRQNEAKFVANSGGRDASAFFALARRCSRMFQNVRAGEMQNEGKRSHGSAAGDVGAKPLRWGKGGAAIANERGRRLSPSTS